MPKSKVRKKIANRRQSPQQLATEEALIVPVWDYPDWAELIIEDEGGTENEAFHALLSMPVSFWNPDRTEVQVHYPFVLARQASQSLKEWYNVIIDLYEAGGIAWDETAKAHYLTELSESLI